MRVEIIEVNNANELEAAFQKAVSKEARAISITWSPMFYLQRERIGELALRRRIPVIGVYGSESPGHLLSYGTDGWLTWRRAGYYVHRLLTGTKVTELPVEQVSTFKLFANMKAAKALGIKLPQSVLVRAEDVLE